MVTIGIDAHKRSHTALACDEHGRELGSRTFASSSVDHARLLGWARRLAGERRFAVEDNRALSRRLERDLLVAGERVVRVPPKLMAKTRAGARTYGKSDAIDALAVARAALREPGLPAARLEGKERELRLLVDHREDLVGERTRMLNRLHGHLHELDPDARWVVGSLGRRVALERLRMRLDGSEGLVASLARELVERALELTLRIDELEGEIAAAVEPLAPSLLAIVGCGHLTAAKIVAETAAVERFRSADAYARYNGTVPLPVSSAGVERHRLSRAGNRQLNAALYRIALTQSQWHPEARTLLARRTVGGGSEQPRASHDRSESLSRRLQIVANPLLGIAARRVVVKLWARQLTM